MLRELESYNLPPPSPPASLSPEPLLTEQPATYSAFSFTLAHTSDQFLCGCPLRSPQNWPYKHPSGRAKPKSDDLLFIGQLRWNTESTQQTLGASIGPKRTGEHSTRGRISVPPPPRLYATSYHLPTPRIRQTERVVFSSYFLSSYGSTKSNRPNSSHTDNAHAIMWRSKTT